MARPIIRTEHLSRFFSTVKAVDDLSLEVPAGIVFGFLGPNGAGKTTTIHLLLGLLEPTRPRDTQRVSEKGENALKNWQRRQKCGYLRENE